jgi:hypothetical protein
MGMMICRDWMSRTYPSTKGVEMEFAGTRCLVSEQRRMPEDARGLWQLGHLGGILVRLDRLHFPPVNNEPSRNA